MPPPPPGFSPIPGPEPRAGGVYPLDLNRILEMTFSIVRFRWRVMLAVSFAVMFPMSLIFGAAAILTADENAQWFEVILQVMRGRPVDVAASFPWGSIAIGLVVGAIVAIGTSVAMAAVTHVAAETYAGRTVDAVAALRKGLSRLPALTGAYLLTLAAFAAIIGLGAFFASFLFAANSLGGELTPGPAVFIGILVFVAALAALIFFSVRWSLIVPSTVVDGTGAVDTLRTSWRLVAGSTWRVLGFLIVIGLMVGMIEFVLSMIVSLAVGAANLSPTQLTQVDPVRLGIANFLTLLIGAALLPFTAAASLLLYFDLKWRAGGSVPTPGVPAPSVPEQQP